jgi:hypothetical protein
VKGLDVLLLGLLPRSGVDCVSLKRTTEALQKQMLMRNFPERRRSAQKIVVIGERSDMKVE